MLPEDSKVFSLSLRSAAGEGRGRGVCFQCGVSEIATHSLRSNWPVARREEGASPRWAVTDEQRSYRPISAQPSGRQFFLAQASLLAPLRPLKGMLVARASPAPKIPCRERLRIHVHDHLARSDSAAALVHRRQALVKQLARLKMNSLGKLYDSMVNLTFKSSVAPFRTRGM